jgi:transcriptional regulator with XRE-family HTH domain
MVLAARTARQLSQEELGRRVGVLHTMISRVESGTRTPSLHLFFALVEELELDLELLRNEPAPAFDESESLA